MGPRGDEAKIRLREYSQGHRIGSSASMTTLSGGWLTGGWRVMSTSLVSHGGSIDFQVYGNDFAQGHSLKIDDVRAVCG